MENRFESKHQYPQFVRGTASSAIDDARYKLSAARHVLNMFAEYYLDCPEEQYLSLCQTMQHVFSQQVAVIISALADVETTLLIARSMSEAAAVPAPDFSLGGVALPDSARPQIAPGENSEGPFAP